ncbi:hypothetical protein K7X08_016022 [Anisodus acutangulus]|uniref:Uncharacterized protein n=1 Tax=Anisodus acutangulus TaxID=402998 RepID=A0A9Q1LE25_9SOLA|nr:hypothetical protein K7X08_016022 [Anisodus acutangulus]
MYDSSDDSTEPLTVLAFKLHQERVQQVPRDSSTLVVQAVQEQGQQVPLDSTTPTENELSGEQGPLAQKRKRGLQIDAEMLATLCAQPPGEGTSVPQSTFHPVNRPSAGSTNQGGE